ncbi:MAG: pyruvate, phosphate dikinase [Anaerolineae bacterium]|nr:pyruvate, phosphate dikinase [Anaerolineae bacterium]
MSEKWVYLFEEVDKAEAVAGSWDGVRALLGGKGANLAEMTRIGVPVPPGFIITTRACIQYQHEGATFLDKIWHDVEAAMAETEKKTGKKFGDPKNPLLVSVRSGAKFSMPGMMDTVLNVGLNDAVAAGLAGLTGDQRFVYDAYRRLVQMFGSVVMDIEDEAFEDYLTELKEKKGYKSDTELTAEEWKQVTAKFKEIFKAHTGREFPSEASEQLKLAAEAVFKSWNGKRAIDYRNAAGISHDLGTAVNVQTMVFGNMGDNSGTGVAFTRNPATGERVLYGDYLINAQGEDVVAGIRNTSPIAQLGEELPEAFKEFTGITEQLEKHYREMQDVEFTIERGKLWMLQTRDGKRTARSTIRIAVEMAEEGLITREQAVMRVKPADVDQLLHPQFDIAAKKDAVDQGKVLAVGVNASPGAAVGVAAFDADLAEEWGKAGKDVIMVRPETKPDDVHGMLAAKGILTSRGGATSHAAVVARQFGIPCVSGAEALKIDVNKRQLSVNNVVIKEGEVISIDGGTGEVFPGAMPTVAPDFEKEEYLRTLLEWADGFKRLGVRANADYPHDARRARSYGAKGIGLTRTEHMFFEQERLPIVQKMILSEPGSAEEQKYLDQLLPFQRSDFYGVLKAMEGLPVIIRLIDPPLHEFLPSRDELVAEVAELRVTGKDPQRLHEAEAMLSEVEKLHEANPMLGLRGVRLGIMRPAINKMQVRAIFEAACDLKKEGVDVYPEVMIPVTANSNELKVMRELLEGVVKQVFAEKGVEVHYMFGTMIELPRACIVADEMAEYAEFFSYGTNDLTQTTYGISRDDAEGKFLLDYVERGLLPANPFQVLDRDGVGYLVKLGVERGRKTRADLEVGICGEHGGDPSSVEFCHEAGLDYVSCSPFRVPIARLAAAHAALKERGVTAK